MSSYAGSRDALWTVFDRAPQHFARLAGTTNRSKRSNDFTGWWHVIDGPPSWARRDCDAWSEYFVRDDDWWRSEERAMDTPCFAAGYTFKATRAAALLTDDAEAWRHRLAEQQVDVFEDGQFVRCMRVLYLNEVVTAGVTLDDQAAAVARWIEQSVAVIDENGPPPKTSPILERTGQFSP